MKSTAHPVFTIIRDFSQSPGREPGGLFCPLPNLHHMPWRRMDSVPLRSRSHVLWEGSIMFKVNLGLRETEVLPLGLTAVPPVLQTIKLSLTHLLKVTGLRPAETGLKAVLPLEPCSAQYIYLILHHNSTLWVKCYISKENNSVFL